MAKHDHSSPNPHPNATQQALKRQRAVERRLLRLHVDEFAADLNPEYRAIVGEPEAYTLPQVTALRLRRAQAVPSMTLCMQTVRLPQHSDAATLIDDEIDALPAEFVTRRIAPPGYEKTLNYQVERYLSGHSIHHPNFQAPLSHNLPEKTVPANEHIEFFYHSKPIDLRLISPSKAYVIFKKLIQAVVDLHRYTGATLAPHFDFSCVRIDAEGQVILNFMPMVKAKKPNVTAISKLLYCLLQQTTDVPRSFHDLNIEGPTADLNLKHFFYCLFENKLVIQEAKKRRQSKSEQSDTLLLTHTDFMTKLSVYDVELILDEYFVRLDIPTAEFVDKINQTFMFVDIRTREKKMLLLRTLIDNFIQQTVTKLWPIDTLLSRAQCLAMLRTHYDKPVTLDQNTFDACVHEQAQQHLLSEHVLQHLHTLWEDVHIPSFYRHHSKQLNELKMLFAESVAKMINQGLEFQTYTLAQRTALARQLIKATRQHFYKNSVLLDFQRGSDAATKLVRDALRSAKKYHLQQQVSAEAVIRLLEGLWEEHPGPYDLDQAQQREVALRELAYVLSERINTEVQFAQHSHDERLDYIDHLIFSDPLAKLLRDPSVLKNYVHHLNDARAQISEAIANQINTDLQRRLDTADVEPMLGPLWADASMAKLNKLNQAQLTKLKIWVAKTLANLINHEHIMLQFTRRQKVAMAQALLEQAQPQMNMETLIAVAHSDPAAQQSIIALFTNLIHLKYHAQLTVDDVLAVISEYQQTQQMSLTSTEPSPAERCQAVLCMELINSEPLFQNYSRDQRTNLARRLFRDKDMVNFFALNSHRLLSGVRDQNYVNRRFLNKIVRERLHRQHERQGSPAYTEVWQFNDIAEKIGQAASEYLQPKHSLWQRVRMFLFGPAKKRVVQLMQLSQNLKQVKHSPLHDNTQAHIALGLARTLLAEINQSWFGKSSRLSQLLRERLGNMVDHPCTESVLAQYRAFQACTQFYREKGLVTYKDVSHPEMWALLHDTDKHRLWFSLQTKGHINQAGQLRRNPEEPAVLFHTTPSAPDEPMYESKSVLRLAKSLPNTPRKANWTRHSPPPMPRRIGRRADPHQSINDDAFPASVSAKLASLIAESDGEAGKARCSLVYDRHWKGADSDSDLDCFEEYAARIQQPNTYERSPVSVMLTRNFAALAPGQATVEARLMG